MTARAATEKSGVRHYRNTGNGTQADTGFLTKGFTALLSARVRGDVWGLEKWQYREESQSLHKPSD